MSFQKDSKVNRFVSDGHVSLNQTNNHNDKQSPKLSFSESSLSTWTQQQTLYTPRFKYILYLFLLILLFDILSPFTTDVYNGILPIMIDENNLNSEPFMIQLSLILFTLFHSFSQIIFTSLVNDCFNLHYGYIISIGLIIYCAASIMCALSSTIQIFIISRTFQGLGAGFAVIIQNELSSALYPSFKLYLTTFLNNLSKGKYSYTTRNIKKNREATPYGATDHHAYSSILTTSDTNYMQSHKHRNNNNLNAFKTRFLLFLLASIRAIVGISSAAPVGSLITYYTRWQNIFFFLALCALLTGIIICPLFSNVNIFQMEICHSNNGLLGISSNGLLAMTGTIKHSVMSSNTNTSKDRDRDRPYFGNEDNPLEMNKNKILIRSPKSVKSVHSVESPFQNQLHNSNESNSNMNKAPFIHLQPQQPQPQHLSQIVKKENYFHYNNFKESIDHDASTLSLSDHTTLTALSVLTNPLNAKLNKINDIDPLNVDKTFMQRFHIFSVYFLCKKPLSLLLLILFSCGYIGILLILCEISFIMNDKGIGDINTGLFIGGMVLCLIIASAISGYCNHLNCKCFLKCFCFFKSLRHDSNNYNAQKSQWILSSIICSLFGIFSFISFVPILKYKFDIDINIFLTNKWIYNTSSKTITIEWIYICVFLYIFGFGFFVPPLMSLLYYSFIKCPVSLFGLIVHFWRNVFAIIIVCLILGLRETIDTIHSNFLHFCITICCFAIFMIYFLFVIPCKMILDKREEIKMRSNIGSSFNDIFSKKDLIAGQNQSHHDQENDQTASPALFNHDGQQQIDLYDGNS